MATHSTILAWKCHGQRSLAGYSPWSHKESDRTEQLTRLQGWGVALLYLCQRLEQGCSSAANTTGIQKEGPVSCSILTLQSLPDDCHLQTFILRNCFMRLWGLAILKFVE